MSALVLHPALLLFLAALAVPIALHFLFRRPERRVAWGAMEILRRAAAASAGKARRRETLVLLARLALVLLLVLGAAAPLVRDGGLARFLGAESAPVAIVLDGSLAAHARDARGTTLFDAACEKAIESLALLPAGTAVSVVLDGSEPRVLLRETLSRAAAAAALRAAAPGFGRRDAAALDRLLADLAPGTRVVRAANLLGAAEPFGASPNAGVARLAVEPESPSVGATVRVSAAIVSSGAASRTARLAIDGVERDRRRVEFAGDGSPLTVAFETTLDRPGFHEVALRLDPGDPLAADDAAFAAVFATGATALKLALPEEGVARPLEAALRAVAASGAAERSVEVSRGAAALAPGEIAVSLLGEGGAWLLSSGSGAPPVEVARRRERAARVVPADPDHPVLRPLLAADPAALERVVVRATIDARVLPGSEVLARFEPGGEPAIVENRGERSIAVLLPLDPASSDLAAGAAHALVPLLAGAIARLAPDAPLTLRRSCGERAALPDPRLAILDADGAILSPEAVRSAPPGVYRLVREGGGVDGRLVLSAETSAAADDGPAPRPGEAIESRAAAGFPLLVLFAAILVLESWLALRASREAR